VSQPLVGDGSAVIEPAAVGVRRPGPTARAVAQFLFLAAVGVVLFMFHGISLHLTPWSQAIVNGIVKYAYPPTGQLDTTVVLFREENLAELGESFPVSYARHAEVLDALASYGPRAVFVDFAFIDARSPEDQALLTRAICDLNARGKVPVYLAAPAPGGGRDEGARVNPVLLECAEAVNAQMDVERGVSGVLTYAHGGGTSAFTWTPAFAMYDVYARVESKPRLSPGDAQPMEIIWGNLASDLNERWMHCTSESALRHLVNILRENPLAAKRTCPHTNTISVLHLLGPHNPGVQKAVANKAIFYGGNFQMVGDRVISPVYDDLPGVYLHAMAYDNLVTFKAAYKRADHHGLSLSSVVNGLLLLFTVVLLLLVDKPPAFARLLLAQLAAVRPGIKWLALGVALLLIGITFAFPTSLSAVLLLVPLLLGVVAVLHLAATRPPRPVSARQFLRVSLLGVGILTVAAALFLLVDARYGVEAGLLLVVLPGYFIYKALVARDVLFVATSVLLVGAAVVSFLPPINLGPRNIVAYVAFFEIARHLMRHADEAAEKYFALRRAHPGPEEWGVGPRVLGVVDWLFTLCCRGDHEETTHEGTTHAVV
jgi:CHASE2 domain-containing sensor protein